MKKQHFFIVLLFALAAIIISNRPRYATTWAATNSNEMVTRAALLDAVNNGVFTANTTIPNDDECVTREQAQAYVNINAITGYDMNELVPKSAFVAATVYYTHEGYFLCFSDSYSTGAGYTSSANALGYAEPWYTVNFKTLYNRPLQVGDQVFKVDDVTKPAVVDDAGPCYATAGYWFFYPSLNAAVQVTSTNTGSQYVLDIVYPSGTSNVSICLIVDVSGTTATVQASASASVSTAVTVDWNYTINGTEAIGTPVTINSGNNLSNVHTINHGSTINTISVSINSFSPSSNGTQNYISGGTCN
ncbi:MAG: hypothetical protein J0L83_14575 [Chitinophagales bacterium]|nr:hypothetical protein [Chitinophagales bacterium]